MATYIILGRRKRDIGLMVDFHKERAMVRANTAWIEGVELENMAPGPSGYKPGMVMISREWNQLYFLNEREGWTDEQYFELARRIMKIQGIKKP